MSANGISGLLTKQLRQEQKLALAEAKRKGQIITEGGGTWSTDGIDNASAPYYRVLNTLDINLLPTKYSGNLVVDNAGLLVAGRPWT
jgi:hypothetical protein